MDGGNAGFSNSFVGRLGFGALQWKSYLVLFVERVYLDAECR